MTIPSASLPTLPGRHTQAIAPSLVVSGYAGSVATYGAPVWPLDPLSANPSADRKQLYWDRFPADSREEFRLLAWVMINNPLPDWFLVGWPAWHSRLSATMLYGAVLEWRTFATWLHSRGVASLAACPETAFGEYARHAAERLGASRATVTRTLSALTRLWAFDAVSPVALGVASPPWVREGVDDYLPAQTSRGENATEPITPATMGPLLIWALRMVDDFAHDILAAWAESQRVTDLADATVGTPTSKARLKRYLEDLTSRGEPVPSRQMFGRTMISSRYIAAGVGCSTSLTVDGDCPGSVGGGVVDDDRRAHGIRVLRLGCWCPPDGARRRQVCPDAGVHVRREDRYGRGAGRSWSVS
ncbi:hypothetical protein [Streptomyces sp. NPDC048473]|uniref:hypothetical protein n=1 Tax=unclassified Streptomyces TaxID=2593676 RepID=UPI00372283A9